MIERIQQALEKEKISVYSIRQTITEGAELYYIRRDLDLRRTKETEQYEVSVYRDFEAEGKPMRGLSNVTIFPEMEEKDIEKKLAEAYYAASFVKNPAYPLPGKAEAGMDTENPEHTVLEKTEAGTGAGISIESTHKEIDTLPLTEIANRYAKALYQADNREDAFINTAEFFVTRKQVSIRNSEGIHVSYQMTEISGEYIVQCKKPQDVEQYHSFSYDGMNEKDLYQDAVEALEGVCARAHAVKAPASGTYDILLHGSDIGQLMEIYASRANLAMIYPGYSSYQVGAQVQGEEIQGEKLNLTVTAMEPYSGEGIRMKELPLIREGILENVHGDARYSAYMGVRPTGVFGGSRLENGTRTEAELKEAPYLQVESFSALGVNPMNGFFGGEIRLAYLYDGKTVTPVTGGSVSGNLTEAQKNLIFSKETYRNRRYEGPALVRIQGVTVAGC
jgi:predicted Zn-dependent protease